MKWLWIVLAVLIGLLLVINFVAGIVSPDTWAFDAALAKCREQGWEKEDLDAPRSRVSGGPFGKTATVEFVSRGKKQPRTIRVVLHKPLNFLAWQVVDYQQED